MVILKVVAAWRAYWPQAIFRHCMVKPISKTYSECMCTEVTSRRHVTTKPFSMLGILCQASTFWIPLTDAAKRATSSEPKTSLHTMALLEGYIR